MSWADRNLGELCSLITDGKHGDCKNEEGSGFFFISCKDVKDGRLNYDNARQIVRTDFAETHRRTDLKPGDVLLTNSGTIGRLAIAPDDDKTERTTFQKSVAVLKPIRELITPHFLYYKLAAENTRLINSAGGAAQKNLLLGELRRFSIRIPPIAMQCSITSTLSAYDDLIENNERRIRILEELARRLYREWFVHFRFPGHERVKLVESAVGRVPEGWEVKRLGDLAEQVRDSVMPDGVPPDTPYFGLEHLPRRSITLGEWGAASAVQSTKLAFRKGDILFGKIRPYFHKVGVAPVDGLCSSDTIVIRSLRPDHFGLVLGCVSSDEFVAHATQTSQGTKMPRANWGVLTRYPLPLPPVRVLRQFSSFATDAVAMTQNLLFRNRNLRETRDLLLPKLVSGEVDVSALTIDR